MPFEPPIISTAYAASIETVLAIIEDIEIKMVKLQKKISQLDTHAMSYNEQLSEAKSVLEALVAFSDMANPDKAAQEEHQRRIAQKKKDIEEMMTKGSSATILEAQGYRIELALLQAAHSEWTGVLPTLEHNRDTTADFEAKLKAASEAKNNPTQS